MTGPQEQLVSVGAVRIPQLRDSFGSLSSLADSIASEGLRRPITVWKDGTVVSGARRHRAHLILMRKQIPAVFVDTIEEAAKRLLGDKEDPYLALPWSWSEVCRLWDLLRRLDAPAAVVRADAIRRRGVELRRMTQAGKRKPGRNPRPTDDYVLATVCGAFGISESTSRRLWSIYNAAYGSETQPQDRRELAQDCLRSIDSGEAAIWSAFQRLMGHRAAPAAPQAAPASAAASRQLAAWDKALPQLEGLTAGLVELGEPHSDLTWAQIRPVQARLRAVRRDLGKMINKMRETEQS